MGIIMIYYPKEINDQSDIIVVWHSRSGACIIHIRIQRKRGLRVAHSQVEVFALPYRTNKQQETYAD